MLNVRLKGLLLTKLPVVYDLLTKVTLKILKALVGIFNKEKAIPVIVKGPFPAPFARPAPDLS